METSFNYVDKNTAFFSSDERRWIARVRKLAEKRPDVVVILKQPEDNDGCIYARMPPRTLKLSLPAAMCEEERQVRAARLAENRARKQK